MADTERTEFEIVVSGNAAKDLEQIQIQQLELAASAGKLRAEISKLEKAEGDHSKELLALRQRLISTRQAQDELRGSAQKLEAGAAGTTKRIGDVAGSVSDLGSIVGRINPQLGSLGDAIGSIGTLANGAAGAFGPWGLALAGAGAAIGLIVHVTNQAEEAQQRLNEARRREAEHWARLPSLIQQTRKVEQLRQGRGSVSEQAEFLQDTRDYVQAQEQRAAAAEKAVERSRRALKRETDAYNDLVVAMEGAPSQPSRAALDAAERNHRRAQLELNASKALVADAKAQLKVAEQASEAAAQRQRELIQGQERLSRLLEFLQREEQRIANAQARAQQRRDQAASIRDAIFQSEAVRSFQRVLNDYAKNPITGYDALLSQQEALESIIATVPEPNDVEGWTRYAEALGQLHQVRDAIIAQDDAFSSTINQLAGEAPLNAGTNQFTQEWINRERYRDRRRRTEREQSLSDALGRASRFTSQGAEGPQGEGLLTQIFGRRSESGLKLAQEQLKQAEEIVQQMRDALPEMPLPDAEVEVWEQYHNQLDRVRSAEERLRDARQAAADASKKEAQARFDEIAGKAESVLGPAISGITGAVSEVIAGTKSADEAFQGLLSSFLEMIGQQSALEAAKEYAAAIASFASQDYGGGALHLLAGGLWTGVAIAAGAGAIATKPAEAKPANPDSGGNQQSTGGGNKTFVINMYGQMITAGSRAELGRELSTLVGEGQRRFAA